MSAANIHDADEWVHVPTLGDHYSPQTGSATITIVRETVRQHALNGKVSRVLVAAGTWEGYDDGAREEVAIKRLGIPPRIHKLLDKVCGVCSARRPFSSRPYKFIGTHLGRQFRGTVFIHNEPAGVDAVVRTCPSSDVCLWAHNELFRSYTKRQALHVLIKCHRVICVSDYIRRQLVEIVGDSPKLVTVHNGVNTNLYCPPSSNRSHNEPPVILFVGRVVPEKGVHVLLKAASILKSRNVQFKVRIVGSSNFNSADSLTPYQLEIKSDAERLGSCVELVPFRPPREIVDEYQRAELLCVPSTWNEPFGLTVLEGMACGIPVLAAACGGIPEVGGDAIMYFERDNPDSLAQALQVLLNQKDRYHSLAASCRDRALSFDYAEQYPKLVAALKK